MPHYLLPVPFDSELDKPWLKLRAVCDSASVTGRVRLSRFGKRLFVFPLGRPTEATVFVHSRKDLAH